MEPELSICIPNYNHARYLPESFEAIFSQSYQPSEVIVIDDGSTDNSVEIVKEYQQKFPVLKLIRHEKNQGLHATLVEGIRIAQGKYLGLFSADDLIMPGCFERSMEVFSRHPDLSVTFGDTYLFMDKKPYQFMRVTLMKRNEPLILSPDEFVAICRKSSFHIQSNTCIFRKDHLEKIDAYNTRDLKSWSDFYLNCQLSFQFPIAYIPHPLGAFRCNPFSYGQSAGSKFSQRKEIALRFLERVEGHGHLFKKRLKRSGLLNFGGFSLILVLITRPKYWHYLPLMVWKKLPDLPQTLWKWMKIFATMKKA